MLAELLAPDRLRLEIGPAHPNFEALVGTVKGAYARKGVPLRYEKDETHLAHYYCDLFNAIQEAGGEITDEMIEAVDHELESEDHVLHFQDGQWSVEGPEEAEEYGKEGELLRYGGRRAPKGGVQINGQVYRGGLWIPGRVLAGASAAERAAMGAAPRGKRDMGHIGQELLHWAKQQATQPGHITSKNLKNLSVLRRLKSIHGGDTNKRLAEHAKEIHTQMKGDDNHALASHLQNVAGMMAIADGGGEDEPPVEGKEDNQLVVTYRTEGDKKVVAWEKVEKSGATFADALTQLVAEIGQKLDGGSNDKTASPDPNQ